MSLRYFVYLLVIALVFFISSSGQSGTDSLSAKQRADEARAIRQAAIQRLILDAGAQPAPISADLLLNIIDAGFIDDHAQKKLLVEDVFAIAKQVKEPFPLRKFHGLTDTRSGYRSMSFELGLDRLSIQLRAVREMLKVDRLKARSMFAEIPPIELKPLECSDSLAYDVSEFYKVLGEVVQKTFTDEERQRNEPIYFAASYIERIDSPFEIGPAIDLVVSLNTTQQEFGILLPRLTSAIREMSSDPRSLALTLQNDGPTEKIKFALIGKIGRMGFQSKDLLDAYRHFLVSNLSESQCSDTLMATTAEKPDPYIETANSLFESPITVDEVRPAKVDPGVVEFRYWTSPKASRLLAAVKKLRFGEGEKPLAPEQRSTQKWQQELIKFLQEMDAWTEEDEETGADYLHQRCVLYYSLIEITPENMRRDLLMNYALFLRDSEMREKEPVQWLGYAKFLMRAGTKLEESEREKFMDALRNSGTQIFGLYYDLETLRGEDPGTLAGQ